MGFYKKLRGLSLFMLGLTISALTFMSLNVKADAAFFTHTHTEECMGTVSGICRNHRLRNEYTSDVFHCTTCGYQTTHHMSIWWDDCLSGLVPSVDVSYTESCNNCGTLRRDESPGEPGGHSYYYRAAVCGKDGNTRVAELSLMPVSLEPTNTGVEILANVDVWDLAFSLCDSPYDFGAGFQVEPSFTVTENGIYSVAVKDSKGNVVSTNVSIDCIDKEVPTIISIVKSTEAWTEEGLEIEIEAMDVESGLADYPYSLDGVNFTDNSSIHISSNGTYTVYVKDKAGNIASIQINIGNIGRDPAIIAAERAEQERIAAEREAREKAEAERIAAEKALLEKAEAERLLKEKEAYEKAKREKEAREKAEKERMIEEARALALLKNSVSQNDVSGNGLLGALNGGGGKISVTKGSLTDKTGDLTPKEIDVFEFNNEEGLKQASKKKREQSFKAMMEAENPIEFMRAGGGRLTIELGFFLLGLGLIFFSFFNYIYTSEDGKKRIIALCKVKYMEGEIWVIVPSKKFKGHSRYLIYFSLWNRLTKNKGNRNTIVKVDGTEDVKTDEGIAFTY